MNTPLFEISSSPWKFSYTADRDGSFVISVKGNPVVSRDVSARQVYETYVYDSIGSLYFSIVSAPTNARWIISVEANPSIPTPTPGTIFTYSGVGQMNTPPFKISSSPWKLRYEADWNGNFVISVKGNPVASWDVSGGRVYETYVYDLTGSLYFSIVSAPTDGHWTLWVVEVELLPPFWG